MSFQYKRILLVGATSGIGAGMAARFVEEGSKVIVVGRRQDRLDAFVNKYGPEKSASIRFDVTDYAGLDSFVKKVLDEYPDLDCVFLNCGYQSQFRLFKLDELDLLAFHRQVNTNFTSLVNMSMKFLPHLVNKQYPTNIVFTGSALGLIPAVLMPAYSASKAALIAFVDCLRAQNQCKTLKITHIIPPIVQTELHDYTGTSGRSWGMPLPEFVEECYAQLKTGAEWVEVGVSFPGEHEEYRVMLDNREKVAGGVTKILLSRFEL
ncbi:NAD(P)-binding protein [Thozetella sp. PMI_491]|nr:NAD(P)-binding protein [Thozetella sp. PMI_491]